MSPAVVARNEGIPESPAPKNGSLSTGRILLRPRQQFAGAPVAWFVTALHMRVRLARFGLTLNEAKTRVLEFGRYAMERRARRGQRRPETFDFLGFTHICGVRRSNRTFIVQRLTVAKRMATTLKAIRASLMKRRHQPIGIVGSWLRSVVQGYLNYHAIPGNLKRLGMFRAEVCRAWLHAIRRRSQRSRMTWDRFKPLIALYIPKVRVLHPYPNQRFAS